MTSMERILVFSETGNPCALLLLGAVSRARPASGCALGVSCEKGKFRCLSGLLFQSEVGVNRQLLSAVLGISVQNGSGTAWVAACVSHAAQRGFCASCLVGEQCCLGYEGQNARCTLGTKLPQLICLSTVISFGLCFHENKIRRINCQTRQETCENQSVFHGSRNSSRLALGFGRLLW